MLSGSDVGVEEGAAGGDDLGDLVAREQAAGEDLDRRRDLVAGRAVDVPALERRLEDVVGVEVEGGEVGGQGARRRIDLAGQREQEDGGDRGGRALRMAGRRAQREAAEVAAALIDRVGLGVADAEHGIAAAVVEIGAEGEAGADDGAVALLGDAEAAGRLEPGEVAPGDEVDDAGDGVGAVDRGAAAGGDVDPLDQGGRDVVDVDDRGDAVGDEALAVEQDEVAVGAEAAQVDIGRAVGAVVDRRADIGDGAGQVADQLLGGDRLLELDLVLVDDLDRARLLEVRIADARAGDDDRFAALAGGSAWAVSTGAGSSWAKAGVAARAEAAQARQSERIAAWRG